MNRHGRHGRVFVALGGLAAVLLLGAAPPNKPESQPKAAPLAAKPNGDRGNGMTAYERESLAVDRAAIRTGERANSIADVQRGYAFLELLLGFAGVFFTAIAAVAAIAAARYAKAAAHAAGESAKADNASLEHARAATLADRRPWVSIVATSASVTGQDGVDYVEFTYTLTNVGQSPATAISVSGQGIKEDEPYALNIADRMIAENEQMESEIRKMGGRREMGTSLFPGEAWTDGQIFSVRRTHSNKLIAGYVAYRSHLTDHTHYTPWAFEFYYPPGDKPQPVEAIVRKFYLTTPPT